MSETARQLIPNIGDATTPPDHFGLKTSANVILGYEHAATPETLPETVPDHPDPSTLGEDEYYLITVLRDIQKRPFHRDVIVVPPQLIDLFINANVDGLVSYIKYIDVVDEQTALDVMEYFEDHGAETLSELESQLDPDPI